MATKLKGTQTDLAISVPDGNGNVVPFKSGNAAYEITRDDLLEFKKAKFFQPAQYLYFAMQIDIANGTIKSINQTWTDTLIDGFCMRWDISESDFHAGIAGLSKKGFAQRQSVQMSLDLFAPDQVAGGE